MITYKWSVSKMTINNASDGVVIYVDWFCTGIDDVNNLTASAAGTAKLGEPANPFTAYADLQESQVLDWCFEPVVYTITDPFDKTTTTITTNLKPETEAEIANQLAHQLTAIAANPPLPWIKQETTP
jgi:hypothetical protein